MEQHAVPSQPDEGLIVAPRAMMSDDAAFSAALLTHEAAFRRLTINETGAFRAGWQAALNHRNALSWPSERAE